MGWRFSNAEDFGLKVERKMETRLQGQCPECETKIDLTIEGSSVEYHCPCGYFYYMSDYQWSDTVTEDGHGVPTEEWKKRLAKAQARFEFSEALLAECSIFDRHGQTVPISNGELYMESAGDMEGGTEYVEHAADLIGSPNWLLVVHKNVPTWRIECIDLQNGVIRRNFVLSFGEVRNDEPDVVGIRLRGEGVPESMIRKIIELDF